MPDSGQIHEAVNTPQQVILRHMIIEVELVEQRRLRFLLRSHHRHQSPKSLGKLNQRQNRQSRTVFQRNKPSADLQSISQIR
jgi:hypothetical protein